VLLAGLDILNNLQEIILEELREVTKVVGAQSKELAILNERLLYTNKHIDSVVTTGDRRWAIYLKSMLIVAIVTSFNILDKDVLKIIGGLLK